MIGIVSLLLLLSSAVTLISIRTVKSLKQTNSSLTHFEAGYLEALLRNTALQDRWCADAFRGQSVWDPAVQITNVDVNYPGLWPGPPDKLATPGKTAGSLILAFDTIQLVPSIWPAVNSVNTSTGGSALVLPVKLNVTLKRVDGTSYGASSLSLKPISFSVLVRSSGTGPAQIVGCFNSSAQACNSFTKSIVLRTDLTPQGCQ